VTTRTIAVEPLTAQAFAPFGEVPTSADGDGRPVNLGTARRLDHVATLDTTRPHAHPNLALFRCAPVTLPFDVTMLERHPHSSQLVLALSGGPWVVCVAPSDAGGEPDVAALRAFRAERGQAVHLARGMWHHPIVVLEHPAELAMLVWEDGGPGDTEERRLDVPLHIVR
jgi:ureidoglycolate lyase